MEMVPHLWEALLAGPLDVVVQFHEPLSLDRMDRKDPGGPSARKSCKPARPQALAGRRLTLNSAACDPITQPE